MINVFVCSEEVLPLISDVTILSNSFPIWLNQFNFHFYVVRVIECKISLLFCLVIFIANLLNKETVPKTFCLRNRRSRFKVNLSERTERLTHTIRWTPNQILTEQTIGAIRFSCWIRFFSFLLFSIHTCTHTGRRVRDTRHGRQRCVVASTVYTAANARLDRLQLRLPNHFYPTESSLAHIHSHTRMRTPML